MVSTVGRELPDAENRRIAHDGQLVAGVLRGLGCKSLRVTDPDKIASARIQAQAMARTYGVPVVVEVILEKVTNIAMGAEIDEINELEEIDCRRPEGRQGLEMAGLPG